MIIAVLPRIDDYLEKKLIAKVVWIPNGTMLDYFPLNYYAFNKNSLLLILDQWAMRMV